MIGLGSDNYHHFIHKKYHSCQSSGIIITGKFTKIVNQVQLDLNNKDHALEIDHGARNLHNNSRSIDTKVSKYIVSNIMMIR